METDELDEEDTVPSVFVTIFQPWVFASVTAMKKWIV